MLKVIFEDTVKQAIGNHPEIIKGWVRDVFEKHHISGSERRRLTLMLTDQRECAPTAPKEATEGRFAILKGQT